MARAGVSRDTFPVQRRRRDGAELVACSAPGCGRLTRDPKLGKCGRCYLRAYRGQHVEPACEACGHGDARALVRRRMQGQPRTLCGNCNAIAGHRRQLTLDELRAEVAPPGDRRRRDRRRGSRRGIERRTADLYGDVELPEHEQRAGGRRAGEAA